MPSQAVVLRSPDILTLVYQYQSGVPHDILAFQYVGSMNELPSDNSVSFFVSWLKTYGTSRLPLLVDSMPHTKSIVVVYAVNHSRVDILQVVFERYGLDALTSSGRISQLAAIKGDVATVEFLYRVGYPCYSEYPAEYALKHGQLSVLQFFVQAADATELRDWIQAHHVHGKVRENDLTATRWLVEVWFPAVSPEAIGPLLFDSMAIATIEGHVEIATWLAPKVQAVLRGDIEIAFIYMMQEKTDFLLPFVDPDVVVLPEDWFKLLYSCTIPRLTTLFSKLTCLQGTKRAEALKQCLDTATCSGHFHVMQWLVETQAMDPLDVRDVFASTKVVDASSFLNANGSTNLLNKYDMKMAGFLATHNIQFERDFMLDVLCTYIHDTKVVDWMALRAQQPKSIVHFAALRFFNLISKEEGSESAVVGRCLQYLVKAYDTPSLAKRRKFYQLWQSIAQDDEVAQSKKRTIEAEMLDEATAEHRDTIIKWLTANISARASQSSASTKESALQRPRRR
ncbi:Aste57867_12647 [Aphanomyces stellatus]|uniref:Aste57867_12647 protein n=1 Tax=Aphanomyces stellatus TaxID=120398 RepID=A0A485KW61_9STRA|nr:hypothetical protein As57867_012601 [Aphanomyces stellatus]VFT89497.1 Aste57867_12647 [Aphanomyces stellatus]